MSSQGVVKSFSGQSGYGFIVCDEKDVFVHIADCTGVPEKEDTVLAYTHLV